ncbi:MAG TPA: hypothetical protein VFR96_04050, partial [Povalibacter sp.]|nr:hypothetical protein [Povalibacter sp.]
MSSTGYSARPATPLIGQRPWRDRSSDVSASEPFAVFALKSLLYPTIPVVTLIICLWFWDPPLYGPYLLVAVLAFLGVADLLDVVPLRIVPAKLMALRSLLDILLRWGVLMCFLWLLLKLSYLGQHFSKPMLAIWALTTPFALWAGEVIAQYMLSRGGQRLRKAIVVGATDLGLQLEQNLAARPTLQIKVQGYFEDRSVPRLPSESLDRVLGQIDDVSDYVRQHSIDIV